MTTGEICMAYKKATAINIDLAFALEICGLFEFFDFGREDQDEKAQFLEFAWSQNPESHFCEESLIDDAAVIRNARVRLGHAITIMLVSTLEDVFKRVLHYIGMKESDVKREFGIRANGERASFLQLWCRFHENRFNTTFTSRGWTYDASSYPLPEGFARRVPHIDMNLLETLVWMRNRIVHHRGEAELGELRARGIPFIGERPKPRGGQVATVAPNGSYLRHATSHTIAFVETVADDLRRREAGRVQ
jgi:hypothetical protein